MSDDEKNVTVKGKDSAASSVKCPMLTSTNYTVWAMRMKIALKVHKVWDTVDPGNKDEEKNNMAIALLFQSISESLVLQVGEHDTSKGVWEAIKARHVGAERVREARLQTLMSEFDRIKMKEEDTIDAFAGKLAEISSNSAALGETIEESKLVKKFLKTLPHKKYIHIVASLEQVLDLKTTTFEDIVGRLKAYEERINEKDEEQQDDQGKLMYVNTDSRQENFGSNRGRGGRSHWRGRGRRRFGYNQNRSYRQVRDKEREAMITCFRCDKQGHFAHSCPDRLLKLQEVVDKKENETHEADELMMHEVVYLNEQKVKPTRFDVNLDCKKHMVS